MKVVKRHYSTGSKSGECETESDSDRRQDLVVFGDRSNFISPFARTGLRLCETYI